MDRLIDRQIDNMYKREIIVFSFYPLPSSFILFFLLYYCYCNPFPFFCYRFLLLPAESLSARKIYNLFFFVLIIDIYINLFFFICLFIVISSILCLFLYLCSTLSSFVSVCVIFLLAFCMFTHERVCLYFCLFVCLFFCIC